MMPLHSFGVGQKPLRDPGCVRESRTCGDDLQKFSLAEEKVQLAMIFTFGFSVAIEIQRCCAASKER